MKISIILVIILLLTGCCQHPDTCYPSDKKGKTSVTGFIMGGGLIGHVIRNAKGKE